MLKIETSRQINSVSVYGDDTRDFVFYLMPQGPRFRTDENGRPIFKYLKYRELRQEGADFFGGLITFDACLAVPDQPLAQVKAVLQQEVNALYVQRGAQAPQVQVGPPVWTQGTVTLSIEGANNQLVQKVNGAGVPSLYGDNVASFWVELTKEGATIFEQAMQGQGGFVAAFYKMKAWAKLPPISGFAEWHADKFYSFSQTIDTDDNFWSEDSYEENISEWSISHDISKVQLDMVAIPGMAADKQQALLDVKAALDKISNDYPASPTKTLPNTCRSASEGDVGSRRSGIPAILPSSPVTMRMRTCASPVPAGELAPGFTH